MENNGKEIKAREFDEVETAIVQVLQKYVSLPAEMLFANVKDIVKVSKPTFIKRRDGLQLDGILFTEKKGKRTLWILEENRKKFIETSGLYTSLERIIIDEGRRLLTALMTIPSEPLAGIPKINRQELINDRCNAFWSMVRVLENKSGKKFADWPPKKPENQAFLIYWPTTSMWAGYIAHVIDEVESKGSLSED